MVSKKGATRLMSDEQFQIYQKSLMPVLYDFFTHYYLRFPSQTCRWGPLVEDFGYSARYRAYFSEQVPDSSIARNTLMVAHVDVLKPHVASSEVVSNWVDNTRSPYVSIQKVIYHDGEVNKVRELGSGPYADLVVTSSDTPEHFVWNVATQPNRQQEQASTRDAPKPKGRSALPEPNVPDLKLVGHREQAQFAMACASGGAAAAAAGGAAQATAARVCSGSAEERDGTAPVLVWDLADHVCAAVGASGGSGAAASSSSKAPTLQPRTRLEGHKATVGGVVFRPGQANELASVGDDEALILWDARAAGQGGRMVGRADNAHRASPKGGPVKLMCVDWSPTDAHLLASGAENGSVRVWDRRRLDAALHSFDLHTADVINVEWHPTARGVFASGGDDHVIALWQLGATNTDVTSPAGSQGRKRSRTSDAAALNPAAASLPPELIFQHHAHRLGEVKDFQWHPTDPWVMMSVHLNPEELDGALQMWRINDLIYRPKEEALRELEQHREFILEGRVAPGAQRPKLAPAPATAAAGGGL